jgi:lysophospholipase L1-like esterase
VERVRYVAIGDSYSIGTAVDEADRWPDQLVARLPRLELVANLAVNGATSGDLIARQLGELDRLRPELVTLLVGVNDVVRGVPDDVYADHVGEILDAIRGRLPAGRIVCVATPDYTRTPRGADYGEPATQRAGIERVNEILRDACEERGVVFVLEPFAISGLVDEDPSLVASDGLHPSGAQYRLWTDAIEPVVRDLLDR